MPSKTQKKLLVSLMLVLFCALLGFAFSCTAKKDDSVHLLKFSSNGQNYDITAVIGEKTISMPKDPVRNGYTFGGWYFDENEWKNPIGSDLKITKDTTVYAKWSLVTYSVTYDLSGGTMGEGSNPSEYTVESADITLAAPTRNGYAFDGWHVGGNRVSTIAKGSTGNITLTAKWVKSGYTISYANTKGVENLNPYAYVISDEPIALKNLEKAGYTFDGWFIGDKKITEIAAGTTGNLELTAKWSLVTYTITYVGPDDEALDIDGFDLPATYTVESDDIPLNEYYLNGYRFVRWTKNGMTVGYIPAGSTGDLVLYGDFEPDTSFEIHYIDSRFGKENYENPQIYEIGEKLPDLLTLEDTIDYTFVGWSNGFEIVTKIDTSEGGTVTLYAEWAQRPELADFSYVVDYSYTGYNPLGFLMITGVADYTVEEIAIPNYVSMIAPGALERCKNVKNLSLPFVGITESDESANTYLGSLFGLSGLDGNSKAVPSSLENLTITGGNINDYAFKNCANLKTITFTENVKSIGAGAMENCSSLVEVTLPFIGERYDESGEYNGVGDYPERPENAKIDYVFGKSFPSTLKKVTITKGFVYEACAINALAALYRSSIEELDYTSVNETIYKDMFSGLESCKTLVVRGNVTKIESISQYSSSLVKIVIPETVTELGEGAFIKASKLKEISIPNVEKIGANAFNGCTTLQKVKTGNNLVSIGEGAFSGCAKLFSLDTGSKLVSIGANAFANCTDLFRFTLPATVTSVGEGAFNGCTNLIEVRNLSDLSSVKGSDDLGGLCKYAWDVYTSESEKSKVDNIDGYLVYNQNDGNILIKYIGSAATAEIPSGVKTINASAFFGNADLVEVIVPVGVEKIGAEAFSNCANLTTVRIADSVTELGEKAFKGCSSLVSVVLPQNLQKIDNELFGGCAALAEIALPSALTEIGKSAFEGCVKLASITLPDGVTSVQSGAFSECSELQSVGTSSNLQFIGEKAFSWCEKLKDITFPENLATIDSGAFENCKSLTSINLPSSLTVLGIDAFAASGLESVEIPKSIKSISENAFIACHSLKSVKLPSELEEIGKKAFYDCLVLSSIELPSGLKTIETAAFAFCEALTVLSLPDGTSTIGSGIVHGAKALKALEVPFIGSNIEDSEHSINYFFYYDGGMFGGISSSPSFESLVVNAGEICRSSFISCNLASLTLGMGVTSIEDGALEPLLALKSLILPFAGRTAADVGGVNQTLEYMFNQINFVRTKTWKNLETFGVLSGEIPASFYDARENDGGTISWKNLVLGKDVTKVSLQIFDTIHNKKVFYMGTEADWNNIEFVENKYVQNSEIRYYYSETNPFADGTVTSGNYWRYGSTKSYYAIWEKPSV